MRTIWDIVEHSLVIAFGVIMLFVFYTIEVRGSFGVEPNRYFRNLELFMGIPIIAFGMVRFISDARRK